MKDGFTEPALVCSVCGCLLRDGYVEDIKVEGVLWKKNAYSHGICVECSFSKIEEEIRELEEMMDDCNPDMVSELEELKGILESQKHAFYVDENPLDCDIGTRGYYTREDGKKIGPIFSRKPSPLIDLGD